MRNRRSFITGMLAVGLVPKPTWADAGNPAFLSAARKPGGQYVLCGLTSNGQIAFELELPSRGHAAAAHPVSAEAVAFARRPGTYAIILDCITGRETARLTAPQGRHFYGHGTFTKQGDLLFTTESDFEAAAGVIGIWDTRNRYQRIGEFSSGGVGPHDIKLMPDGQSLVVANGGIETHPDTGRTKLNIPTMQSNLSYLSFDGRVLGQMNLGEAHQRNSIRHLAVSASGEVAFAMQWQGDLAEDLPLLGVHNSETKKLDLITAASIRRMNGYLGSVAISEGGRSIAATSPRAGIVQYFRRTTLAHEVSIGDVCGVASSDVGFVLTTGQGLVKPSSGLAVPHDLAWDNHLVAI